MELLPILNLNYNFTLTFFHFAFYPYYLEMKAPFISIPNKIIKEIIKKINIPLIPYLFSSNQIESNLSLPLFSLASGDRCLAAVAAGA